MKGVKRYVLIVGFVRHSFGFTHNELKIRYRPYSFWVNLVRYITKLIFPLIFLKNIVSLAFGIGELLSLSEFSLELAQYWYSLGRKRVCALA